MTIGSIEFLSLVSHKSRITGMQTGYMLTFCGTPDDDDGEEVDRHLTVQQLQELYVHVRGLLSQANRLPSLAKAEPTPKPEVDVDDDDFDDDPEDRSADTERVRGKTRPTAKSAGPYAQYRSGVVVPHHIGTFADKVAANKLRDPRRVATRVLEEVVELVLATGATTQMVYSAVADAIHNQALKLSAFSGRTVFPSQVAYTFNILEVQREIADVRLVLLDLMWMTKTSENRVASEMARKLRNLLTHSPSDFATDGHTFYLKKPHVQTQATGL
jgi:hypothetical protein